MDKSKLYQYILLLGDASMILAHRLSELCGHGPNLETDIALTNISLDLFGQVRNYFQYAATLTEEDQTEDDIAFLRLEHEYRNMKLVEQPSTDFAFVIARQYFYDTYHLLLLEALMDSSDKRISAIAHKSIKEVRYHHRFSSEWMKRLGDGTDISKEKLQVAVDHIMPFTPELFEASPIEMWAQETGVGADLSRIEEAWLKDITQVMTEAKIQIPEIKWPQTGGKRGMHTEEMGYMLADFQYMQRAYPDMTW